MKNQTHACTQTKNDEEVGGSDRPALREDVAAIVWDLVTTNEEAFHITDVRTEEDEIKSLYQTDDFGHALEQVKGCCSVIAITRGGDGSVVLHGDERFEIGVFDLGDLVDTTGAGDLYAGGFLHAYTQGESLERCGQLGALCAGQIVTQLGARSTVSFKELVATHLS